MDQDTVSTFLDHALLLESTIPGLVAAIISAFHSQVGLTSELQTLFENTLASALLLQKSTVDSQTV